MAKRIALHDPELGPLTRDRLTRDYVVYQRAEGHRFSVDDVATAWIASRALEAPRRILDLGCGLGSVLLHLAWRFPEASLVGVEAQNASFELVRRNVLENQLASRIQLVHGDLNDGTVRERVGTNFDLVTGTPPYFPAETATDADDAQRAFARIEYRGGVDAYIRAASSAVASTGRLVLCGAPIAESRVRDAAAQQSMHVVARTTVIGREGRPALFAVWTLARGHAPFTADEITIRDRDGVRTEAARDLTRFSGLEPRS